MIKDTIFENVINKKVYEDVLWEYDTNLIQIIKKKINNNKITYNLTFDNLKQKYDVMIFLNEKYDEFTGYCNCEQGKQGKHCEHLIWGLLKINEDLKEQQKEESTENKTKFKLNLLQELSAYNAHEYEVNFKIIIKNFSKDNVEFEVKSNVNKHTDYKITNVEKLIENIKLKKPLKYGKHFDVQSYELSNKTKELLLILDYINLSLKAQLSSINSLKINYDFLYLILKPYINEYIYYKDEEYLISEGIKDVNLFVSPTVDNSQKLTIEFLKQNDYEILASNISINNKTKTIHLLNKNDLKKLELLQVMQKSIVAESDYNSLQEAKHKVDLTEEDSKVVLKEVLPKIFNDFDVQLDNRLNLSVVSEQLKVEIYCYKNKKDICVKPRFLYGEYDALENDEHILIRRNKSRENSAFKYIRDFGYEYDPFNKEFTISSKRGQFLFLTNDIFEMKDNYNVNLEDGLKNAILSFDSSTISVNINKDKKYDYFEIDFNIPHIKSKEVDAIIKAFEEERTFYKLEDDSFMKLNDTRIYEQLLFVKDVIKDNSYKLNSNRIPKFRALQLESEVKNKFNKFNFNQSFLNYIDSIKLIEQVKEEQFDKFDYELRKYQKEGVSWLSNLYEAKLGALLADEMGLGKTLQTISFLQVKQITSALIVVPKALIYNWVNEIEKFAPELNILTIDGNKAQREKAIQKIDNNVVVITNYNTIINDYKLYENKNFNTLIIDEAQYIKNATSKTARCIKLLKAEFFIALTGTPIENNLLEMWSIFDFLMPGYFSDLNSFNKKYKVNKNITNIEILKESSAPFILRRLKKDVLKELPKKQETNVMCEMEDVQKTIYHEYNEKVKSEIEQYVANGQYNKKSIEILSAITKLRQIAITPQLVTPEYNQNSGKLETFLELIDEIVGSQKSVLVFSQYTSLLTILKEKVEDKGIKYYYLDGKTKPKQRLIDVERFNKNNVPVYFISLKVGGVGLNLTKASSVIIMDPWWNPAIENQAIDRVHRIGQTNNVDVYRIISRGSIEEQVLNIKKDKEKIINEVLENSNEDIVNMSQKDLIELLTL